jgi:hypothetical protein
VKTVIILLILLIPACCFSYEIDPYPGSKESLLNLVLCPVNYQQKEMFAGDSAAIIAGLSKTVPFNEFPGRIAFFSLDLSPEEQKRFFEAVQGMPPLKIRQDLLDTIGNSFKGAYKLVVIDAQGGWSCAELSQAGKTSVLIIGRMRYTEEKSFTKGFLHELGHSLGLRDECPDCSRLSEPGFPNCAVTKADALKYWGDLAGKGNGVNFVAGCCGNRSYIRPTLGSFMNNADKAGDYGAVNERYLRGELAQYPHSGE